MIARWLARALVASFLVNVLLSVWLYQSRKTTRDVEQSVIEYAQARTVYGTVKAERLPALIKYRTLRDTLHITDTAQVRATLAAADTLIASDERALAAADTALARADVLIDVLLRKAKPKLIQPFVEILYSPYSTEYVGRLGIGVNISRRLALVVAGEARRDGPRAYVGARLTF